ncbi:MAG: Sua5/YciO/YrdC/YwlC family protein [Bacteroidota bacterium]
MFAQEDLENIKSTMGSGGLILYPTDTVWSIGCDATDPVAIERLLRIKQNRPEDPFTILVDSLDMLKDYIAHVHPRIDTLLHYHNRPLTVVFNKAHHLAPNLTGPDGSIGARIVKDEFCRRLIRGFGKPIVATSASRTAGAFPSNFGSINSDIISGVDYVVKYRQYEKHGMGPSVMVHVSDSGELTFLRN